MNNIYLLVGPSGCGKTTIANKLHDIYGYKVVESYTTRPPRYLGETGHLFISQEEFDEMRDNLVAYTFYNGYEYGVTADEIDENDIYVIDIPGVIELLKKYNGKKGIKIYTIRANRLECGWRMFKRGDRIRNIFKRLKADKTAFSDNLLYSIQDLAVTNYDLDCTVEELNFLIECSEKYDLPFTRDDLKN